LPSDLRGCSGGAGGNVINSISGVPAAGGQGVSGLVIIARDAVLGIIDLSGVEGTTGAFDSTLEAHAGSGGSGSGGECLVLIDGASGNAAQTENFLSARPDTIVVTQN